MALYIFTAIALYYCISWIGMLFALKAFDYFAGTCKESWFWHFLATCSNIALAIKCYIDPTFMDSSLTTFSMWLWSIMILVHLLPLIIGKVSEFHKKQKDKRK